MYCITPSAGNLQIYEDRIEQTFNLKDSEGQMCIGNRHRNVRLELVKLLSWLLFYVFKI